MKDELRERFQKQMGFIIEIDKLKDILRQSINISSKRRENDAEHSWHMAMTALVMYEYAVPEVDLSRVLKMALVHDLIEIDAGDTYAYDTVGYADKSEREKKAADRIFSLLPDVQGLELRTIWEEFDAMETPDARFANAADRLQPLIINFYTQGQSWKQHGTSIDAVYKRMDIIRQSMPDIWKFAESIILESGERGYLKKD